MSGTMFTMMCVFIVFGIIGVIAFLRPPTDDTDIHIPLKDEKE